MEHKVLAAFDRGQMPVISLVNVAKTPLGLDFAKLAAALQTYVSSHFAPVWGLPCKVQVATGHTIPSGTWALLFSDDADQAGILGYHDLTPDGLPISHVFVKTSVAAGESISVTASHELAEMLLNPACNRWVQDHRGIFWAMEASDQVEDSHFVVDGFDMSNFLYPAAWEPFRKPGSTKFDHLGITTRPFQIARNGYAILARGGREQQVFGSTEKETAFAQEDRRMHRGERIKGESTTEAIPTVQD